MVEQLPLNVRLREGVSFDSFFAGGNAQAVACLEDMAEGRGERQVFVWGATQTGKSHLLQAVCQRAYARGAQAIYVPMAEFTEPGALSDLDQSGVLCIDDLDAVAGKPIWEEALFHLINRSRDAQRVLLLASTQNPAHLGTTLDDLASRLLWGPVFRLQRLTDEQKLDALRARAEQRGLELPREAGVYLMRNCPRDLGRLLGIFDELDQASLVAQRRITVPFIKSVLDL